MANGDNNNGYGMGPGTDRARQALSDAIDRTNSTPGLGEALAQGLGTSDSGNGDGVFCPPPSPPTPPPGGTITPEGSLGDEPQQLPFAPITLCGKDRTFVLSQPENETFQFVTQESLNQDLTPYAHLSPTSDFYNQPWQNIAQVSDHFRFLCGSFWTTEALSFLGRLGDRFGYQYFGIHNQALARNINEFLRADIRGIPFFIDITPAHVNLVDPEAVYSTTERITVSAKSKYFRSGVTIPFNNGDDFNFNFWQEFILGRDSTSRSAVSAGVLPAGYTFTEVFPRRRFLDLTFRMKVPILPSEGANNLPVGNIGTRLHIANWDTQFNFIADRYEEAITPFASDNRLEPILPNMYVAASERFNPDFVINSDYRWLLNLGGAVVGALFFQAPLSIEIFRVGETNYFNQWGRAFDTAASRTPQGPEQVSPGGIIIPGQPSPVNLGRGTDALGAAFGTSGFPYPEQAAKYSKILFSPTEIPLLSTHNSFRGSFPLNMDMNFTTDLAQLGVADFINQNGSGYLLMRTFFDPALERLLINREFTVATKKMLSKQNTSYTIQEDQVHRVLDLTEWIGYVDRLLEQKIRFSGETEMVDPLAETPRAEIPRFGGQAELLPQDFGGQPGPPAESPADLAGEGDTCLQDSDCGPGLRCDGVRVIERLGEVRTLPGRCRRVPGQPFVSPGVRPEEQELTPTTPEILPYPLAPYLEIRTPAVPPGTFVDLTMQNLADQRLRLFVLRGELDRFVQENSRTFAEILTGTPAESETIFYKISKHSVGTGGRVSSNADEEFYIPNSSELDILNFVDTQINYEKDYQYNVYAYQVVLGSEYQYVTPTDRLADLGSGAPEVDLGGDLQPARPRTDPNQVEGSPNSPGIPQLNNIVLAPDAEDAPPAQLPGNRDRQRRGPDIGAMGQRNQRTSSTVPRPFGQPTARGGRNTSEALGGLGYTPAVDIGVSGEDITPRTSTAANPIISEDGQAQIDVVVRPSVQLVEAPLFNFRISVVDKPPVYPQVEFWPYRGINNRMSFLLSPIGGDVYEVPVILRGGDDAIFERIQERQGVAEGAKIKFNPDDPVSQYQIFRITSPPATYDDFFEKLHDVVYIENYGSCGGDPQSALFNDFITPNRKYYYTFRSVDIRGNISNPSPIFEIEMVDTDGAIYPIIREYLLPEKPHGTLTKTVKKFLMIGPSFQQERVSFPDNNPDSALGQTVNLGSAELDKRIFTDPNTNFQKGTKFKIRVTSRQTGRKFDLNVKFKHEHEEDLKC